MVRVHCDACGTVLAPNDTTPDPNIKTFVNYEFCEGCFEKLEKKWAQAFEECGHDMSLFIKKQVEVADGFVSPSSTNAKPKPKKAAPAAPAAAPKKTGKAAKSTKAKSGTKKK